MVLVSADAIASILAPAIGGFIAASGGFWVYLQRRIKNRDANTALLMGLARDKIVYFGMKYIEKGYVTKDEYDDLIRYFYEPYMAVGGDGTAERIMTLVQALPLTLDQHHFADAIYKGQENVIRKLEEEGDSFERRQKPRD